MAVALALGRERVWTIRKTKKKEQMTLGTNSTEKQKKKTIQDLRYGNWQCEGHINKMDLTHR